MAKEVSELSNQPMGDLAPIYLSTAALLHLVRDHPLLTGVLRDGDPGGSKAFILKGTSRTDHIGGGVRPSRRFRLSDRERQDIECLSKAYS